MAEPHALSETRDQAIRRLVTGAGRRAFAIAFDLLGSRADAEDAVQEALARALAGFGRMRDPDALEAWFLRVLTNLCLRSLRRRRIARVFLRAWQRDDAVPPPTAGLGKDSELLLATLEKLAPMQKAVLVLRYGHDLGTDEIAALLGIGAESVKTHLKRARAHMRERLGADDAPG
jgi:RNA polymerase sigma-70 factor, ECF subfamily